MSSEKRKREDEEAEPNRAESQSLAPCLSLIEIDGNQSSNSKTTIDNFNFHLKSVYAVIYINELEIIATSSYDKTIEIWKKNLNAKDWKPIQTLIGHTWGVFCLAYLSISQTEVLIFSGSGDHDIRIWKSKNNTTQNGIQFECIEVVKHHEFEVRSLTVSKTNKHGSFLFSGGYDYSIIQWKIVDNLKLELIQKFETEGPTYGLLTTKEENDLFWLFCCGWSREINAIPIKTTNSNTNLTKQTLRGIEGHQSLVTCICFDSDFQRLYSGSMDGIVKRWKLDFKNKNTNMENNKHEDQDSFFDCDLVPKFDSAVNSLVFVSEKNLIVAASDNGILRFWQSDAKTKELKHSFDISLKNNQTIRSLSLIQQTNTILCGLEQ